MQFSNTEIPKLSRSSLTKTLKKICNALKTHNSKEVTFTDRYTGTRKTTTVTIQRLWVCGSYARGASACGDLDLVAEIKEVGGYRPPIGAIKIALFGATKHVSLYLGTPYNNNSGVKFEEAQEVWSIYIDNSPAIIDAIPECPTAGHFSRKTDIVPLRLEQINCQLETLDEIVDLHLRGKIEWEFIEFSPFVNNATLREDEKRVLMSCQVCAGRDLNCVLPSILITLRHHRPGGFWSSIVDKSGYRLRYSKIAISFKTLEWSSTAFFKMEIDEQGFVPIHSKRGPNGIWLIRHS